MSIFGKREPDDLMERLLPTSPERSSFSAKTSSSEYNAPEAPNLLRRTHWRLGLSFLANLILALALAVSLFLLSQNKDPSLGIYSPANEAIEYNNLVFKKGYGHDLSPYQGPPSPRMDEAWDKLYEHGVRLHIDKASANKLPNKTLPIPGMEGQYITGLDVFHQLHCLNMFRKSFYPEYYDSAGVFFANGTRDDDVTLHFGHCLEHLRQAVMCHADVSTLYYMWDTQTEQAKMSMEITHTCRNFEKVREWAFKRHLEDFDRSTRVLD